MSRIKELREENNVDQKELAKYLGVSQQTISRYEHGREPKLETWQKIADFFDVPVSYLQGNDKELKAWQDKELKVWQGVINKAKEYNIELDFDAKTLRNELAHGQLPKSLESAILKIYLINEIANNQLNTVKFKINKKDFDNIETYTNNYLKLYAEAMSNNQDAKKRFDEINKILKEGQPETDKDDATTKPEK